LGGAPENRREENEKETPSKTRRKKIRERNAPQKNQRTKIASSLLYFRHVKNVSFGQKNSRFYLAGDPRATAIGASARGAWFFAATHLQIPPSPPAHQPPSFKIGNRETKDLRRRTGIMPVKDPHTRIKPLALASGNGRYRCVITVSPERALVTVCRWGIWPLCVM
jgi:hypothetical protein